MTDEDSPDYPNSPYLAAMLRQLAPDGDPTAVLARYVGIIERFLAGEGDAVGD